MNNLLPMPWSNENPTKSISIYIHIPYCLSKCPYCSFNSYEISKDKHPPQEYLDAIREEIKLLCENPQISHASVKSVYVGGGTPSLLSIEQLKELFNSLKSSFNLASKSLIETTVEINPGTLNTSQPERYLEIGINRLIIGVQSFNPKDLKTLSRIHSVKDSEKLLLSLRELKFANFGLDLIYGIPGQTQKDWLFNLEKACEFQPTHISAYNLTLEEKTDFKDNVDKGFLLMPNENDDYLKFESTVDNLKEKGFHQYEVSNFAKKGFESDHNLNYWKGGSYIGLGAGAHSFFNTLKTRYSNVKSPNEYINRLKNGTMPVDFKENLSDKQIAFESLLLGLRTREGITKDLFKHSAKTTSFSKIIHKFKCLDLLTVSKNRIILTKKGLFISDGIIEKLADYL